MTNAKKIENEIMTSIGDNFAGFNTGFVARQICEQHGGTITWCSNDGQRIKSYAPSYEVELPDGSSLLITWQDVIAD